MEAAERSLCEFRQGALLLKAVFFLLTHLSKSANEQSVSAVFLQRKMLCCLPPPFHQFICQVAATPIWSKVYLHSFFKYAIL